MRPNQVQDPIGQASKDIHLPLLELPTSIFGSIWHDSRVSTLQA